MAKNRKKVDENAEIPRVPNAPGITTVIFLTGIGQGTLTTWESLKLKKLPRVGDYIVFKGKPEMWQAASVCWLYDKDSTEEPSVTVTLKLCHIKPLPTGPATPGVGRA